MATIANKIYISSNNGDIYFDDITITKFESLTSNITEQTIQQAHTLNQWQMGSYNNTSYVNSVTFTLSPEYICNYETNADGSQKVNFTDYNAGSGFVATSRIQVNAIYKNNQNIKAIVALWYNQQNIDIQGWQRLIMNGTIYLYDNGDPGNEIEPYGWIKFYSNDVDVLKSNEVQI
ncbi:hypothetical protein ABE244_28090 [Bacillus toyonensis]|uniref:hypothetical protein n=1 Tax=Bacillus toyonensis TaxID=155322 RepID=UPI003D2164D8